MLETVGFILVITALALLVGNLAQGVFKVVGWAILVVLALLIGRTLLADNFGDIGAGIWNFFTDERPVEVRTQNQVERVPAGGGVDSSSVNTTSDTSDIPYQSSPIPPVGDDPVQYTSPPFQNQSPTSNSGDIYGDTTDPATNPSELTRPTRGIRGGW